MMPKILIATHNRWKFKLFAPVLIRYGFEPISLKDVETTPNPPVECGRTVVENALIKARHYHSAEFPWVFGDDTGLEIDALNREPGVQFHRWGGRFSEDTDDQTWLDYLLSRMQSVPPEERTAQFVDGWALLDPNKNEYTREIRESFMIAAHAIRPPVPGSPVMAVALGIPEDPIQILQEVKNKWKDWGIMEKLRKDDLL
jgi:non-canonical purine NTP pyrophosphatase (RdgB/HAM1 family)